MPTEEHADMDWINGLRQAQAICEEIAMNRDWRDTDYRQAALDCANAIRRHIANHPQKRKVRG